MDEPIVPGDISPLIPAPAVWDSALPGPALRVPDLAAAATDEHSGPDASSRQGLSLPENLLQPDRTGSPGPAEGLSLSHPLLDVDGPAPGDPRTASEADDPGDAIYTLPADFLSDEEPATAMEPVTLPASVVESAGSVSAGPRPAFSSPPERTRPGLVKWPAQGGNRRTPALIALSATVAAVLVALVISKGHGPSVQRLDANALRPPATSTIPGRTVTAVPPSVGTTVPSGNAIGGVPPTDVHPAPPDGSAAPTPGPTSTPSPGRAPTGAAGPTGSPLRGNIATPAAEPLPASAGAAPPVADAAPPTTNASPPATRSSPPVNADPPAHDAAPAPIDDSTAPTAPPVRNRRDTTTSVAPVITVPTTQPESPITSLPGKTCLEGNPPHVVTCGGSPAP